MGKGQLNVEMTNWRRYDHTVANFFAMTRPERNKKVGQIISQSSWQFWMLLNFECLFESLFTKWLSRVTMGLSQNSHLPKEKKRRLLWVTFSSLPGSSPSSRLTLLFLSEQLCTFFFLGKSSDCSHPLFLFSQNTSGTDWGPRIVF